MFICNFRTNYNFAWIYDTFLQTFYIFEKKKQQKLIYPKTYSSFSLFFSKAFCLWLVILVSNEKFSLRICMHSLLIVCVCLYQINGVVENFLVHIQKYSKCLSFSMFDISCQFIRHITCIHNIISNRKSFYHFKIEILFQWTWIELFSTQVSHKNQDRVKLFSSFSFCYSRTRFHAL